MTESGTIYLTDNGRALCGDHLGSSAKRTGRDISGQEILPVTPELAAEYKAEFGGTIECETCGAQPGDREVFAGHIARVSKMSTSQLAALVEEPPATVRAFVRETT